MRAIIVAAFVAGSFSAAIADDSPSPKQRAEKFFHALAEKGPGPAFDLLFEGSSITSQKPQAVDAMKRQTEAALPMYGKILDSELVEEKAVGKSVVLLVYVQRLEQHPLIWRFWFYKPHDRWYLSTVFFNDQLQGVPGT